MQKKTLLEAFVDAVAASIADSGEPTKEQWLSFCRNHGVLETLQGDADALISWLPSACEVLAGIIQDPLESWENKVIASSGLNYVLMPYDLIPDEQGEDGAYGFLDDAVLVGACLKEMLEDCPPSVHQLHDRVASSLQAVLEGFPAETRTLLARQMNLLAETATNFQVNRKG